jgi:POT family proton-dependent oligopeptide transporter
MKRITTPGKHARGSNLLLVSKALERAGHYGVRALMLLYITGSAFELSRIEALELYSYFTGGYYISVFIGGFLGDLLIGNKRAIIYGGFIQALGAYLLMFPYMSTLYVGFSLIIIGGGLYNPNIVAEFGKQYKNKVELLVAGFTLFTISIAIGSFVGPLLIGGLGMNFGFAYGFFTSGTALLASVIILVYFKSLSVDDLVYDYEKSAVIDRIEIEETSVIAEDANNKPGGKRWVFIIIGAILLGILFMTSYEYTMKDFMVLKLNLMDTLDLPISAWSGGESILTILFGLAAAYFWSMYYNRPIVNIALGFFLAALSLLMVLLIPENPDQSHVIYLLLSVFAVSAAEILVGPAVNAIIVKFANTKYLAIIFSLKSISIAFYASALFFREGFSIPIVSAIIIYIIVGGVLLIISKSKKIAGKNQLL